MQRSNTFCSTAYRIFLLTLILLASMFVEAQPESKCRYDQHLPMVTDAIARQSHVSENQALYIPVVFHIVYNNPNQNVSIAQIQSQLDVINEDFSRKNMDASQTLDAFKSVAGDPNIQFYLARFNEITGVTRTSTTHGPFANDDLHLTAKGGKDAWDTNKYLNVWVADLGGQLFGYGASPGTPSFRDGVAVHFEYFGRNGSAISPYNLGRTLTHEIGHWLGLQHLWGNGGCSGTDGIDDTPLQENPVSACDVNAVSCGKVSMVQNFMNSAPDGCMNLFTIGQCEYMRRTLMQQRPEAFSSHFLVTATEQEIDPIRAIFPNPLRDRQTITVRFQEDRAVSLAFRLVDIHGKVIRAIQLENMSNELEIDMADVADGLYFALVISGSQEIKKKIIIHRNL